MQFRPVRSAVPNATAIGATPLRTCACSNACHQGGERPNRPLSFSQEICHEAREKIDSKTFQSRNPDRKSTRLNSSHSQISYAVFCLKKKKKKNDINRH